MKLFQSSVEKSLYLLLLLVFSTGIFLGFNAYQQGKQTHNTLINNCQVGNDFRTTEKNLWLFILSLPSTQVPTPEQAARIDQFENYLDKAFALRDCSKL